MVLYLSEKEKRKRIWPLLGVEKFIVDKRESIARGRDIWESPEWTQPWAGLCEERTEGKGERAKGRGASNQETGIAKMAGLFGSQRS